MLDPGLELTALRTRLFGPLTPRSLVKSRVRISCSISLLHRRDHLVVEPTSFGPTLRVFRQFLKDLNGRFGRIIHSSGY
jgi:hypothetical protein